LPSALLLVVIHDLDFIGVALKVGGSEERRSEERFLDCVGRPVVGATGKKKRRPASLGMTATAEAGRKREEGQVTPHEHPHPFVHDKLLHIGV
jgi:hypothetical protein